MEPRSIMSSDVVVVDDDARVRRVMVRVLEQANIAVRGYGSALAALDLVLAHPPSVLITDLRMPELDGIGLAAAVRGGLSERSPRILLLTAEPLAVRPKDKHLFDLILGKPWDNLVLTNAVLPWVRASIPPPPMAQAS
jgi:CheY-like chemotaxis protein